MDSPPLKASPKRIDATASKSNAIPFSSPAPNIRPPDPEPVPIQAQAVITRNGRAYAPRFHSGHSERLAINLNQSVPIQVSWPEDTTSTGVFVQAIQGGRIDGSGNGKTFDISKTKTISFNFTPTTGSGMYQVILRRGTIEEALEFWVPTGNPDNEPPTI